VGIAKNVAYRPILTEVRDNVTPLRFSERREAGSLLPIFDF